MHGHDVERDIKRYGSSNGIYFFLRREELMCHPNQEGYITWFYGVKPIGDYDQRVSLESF